RCNRARPCERCIGLGITGSCVYETEDPKVLEKLDLSNPACEVKRLRDRVAELEGVVRILKGRPHPKQHRNSASSASVDASSCAGSPTPGHLSPTFTCSHSQSAGHWSPRGNVNGPIHDILDPRELRNGSVDSVGSAPQMQHIPRSNRSFSFKSDYDALADSMSDDSCSFPDGGTPQPRQSSCPPGMKGYAEDRNVIQDEEDGRKLFLGHAAGGSLLRKLQGLTSPDLKPHRLDSIVSPPEKDEIITAKVAYNGLFGGEIGKRWAFDMPGSATSSSEAVKVILDSLPSPKCAKQLLEIFLQDVDCFYHAWHTPTLVNYYEKFFQMSRIEQERFPFGKLSVILAIITVTLDLTTDILDDTEARHPEAHEDHQKRFKIWRSTFSHRMASCTVHCLKMASYLGHPSLECIQTQILLSLYMVNNGRCTDAWCFIGGVIKQAQCLGLHIDPSKLNPHMPVYEQEVRRRIWWSTQTWDVYLGIAFGWPAGVTLNDSDLPSDRSEESLMGDAPVQPPGLPPDGLTELTYHIFNWETCLYARDMMDRIFGQAAWNWGKSTDTEGPKYEEVTRLDVTIKTWYNRVPHIMRFEPDPLEIHASHGTSNPGIKTQLPPEVFQPSSSGVGVKDIKRRDPKLAKQSLLLAISQNTILLLLHRPFISHSLENTPPALRNKTSEEQCIRSSQVIIEAQSLLVELFPATIRMWYGWYQTFHAAMTCAWISLLRAPTHPMSGVARKCVSLAIETFEMAYSTPENMPDTHPNACSQLRAIQSFINRKLNPTKTLTNPAHIFGANMALSPFAYSIGPHTMTRLASTIELGDQSLPSSAAELHPRGSHILQAPSGHFQVPQPSSLTHAYQIQSPYAPQPSDLNRALDSTSASMLSPGSDTQQIQQHSFHPQFDQLHRGSSSLPHFTPSSHDEKRNQYHFQSDSSASQSSHRSAQSTVENRSSPTDRQFQSIDDYPSISQLVPPNLPSIQGYISPNSAMNYCDVGSTSSAQSLYVAQYALGSLPYQDVHVPLSMLLMQDINIGGQQTIPTQTPNGRYSMASGGKNNGDRPEEPIHSINTIW
ncbi:hypothetical protein BY996DRAFT_4586403, partial [Phakopsora pachyrhizi]